MSDYYDESHEPEPWEKDSMKFSVNIESLQEELFVTAIANDLANRVSTKMIKKIEAHVEETVVAKLTARVDEVIDGLIADGMQAKMQPSDQFSNPKGEPVTLTEFIAAKATGYLWETVGSDGKPAKPSAYSSKTTSRLDYMLGRVIDAKFEKEITSGVSEIKNTIREQMRSAAAEWLAKFQAETVSGIEKAKALASRI